MKLKEVSKPFEKHRFITYNSRGDKAVYHNVEVQNIFQNVYKDKNKGDPYNEFCNIYVLYEGDSVGIWVSSTNTDYDVTELMNEINRNLLQSKDAYVSRLKNMIENNSYVQLLEIEFAKYIAPELIDRLIAAKENRIKMREVKRKEMEEERKREEELRANKDNEETEKEIANFIDKVKNGGVFENSEITIHENGDDGKTYNTIVYLMEKNGIKIHIRTKGWIMNNAQFFTFKDGKCISVSYMKHYGSKSKGSTKIFDLINELTKIIMGC